VQPAVTITLEQVPALKINQKVNATATISLGNEQPKPVEVKSTKKMIPVKEDCVLKDETGAAEIHSWEEFISKVRNGTGNVRVPKPQRQALQRKHPLGSNTNDFLQGS